MKKIISLLMIAALIFTLSACHQKEPNETMDPTNTENDITPESQSKETLDPSSTDSEWTGPTQLYVDGEPYDPENHELLDPIVNFKQIVHGFIPMFVMEVENPNDSDVSCSYTVTFSEDGKQVGSADGLFFTAIKAHEKALFYSEFGIPEKASEIQEKLIYVAKASTAPIDCVVEEKQKTNDSLELSVKKNSDGTPVLTVTFYNTGEIVGVCSQTIDENTDCTFEGLPPFDEYRVYIGTN